MAEGMPNLRALMPEVEAADAEWDRAVNVARGNREADAATAAYNAVLKRAVEAIYLDTKDVNSRSTIESVYGRESAQGGLLIGFSPLAVLRHLLERWG